MFTQILYTSTFFLLIISYFKDKTKTKKALLKAWKSFENILPSILTVLLVIGFLLTFISPELITKLIGKDSGIKGMFIAAFTGSITLMPGFVVFPLSASLLEAGAGYPQIAMFISTLMMVGIATLPLETRYFGKSVALKRNFISFIIAVLISLGIGVIIL